MHSSFTLSFFTLSSVQQGLIIIWLNLLVHIFTFSWFWFCWWTCHFREPIILFRYMLVLSFCVVWITVSYSFCEDRVVLPTPSLTIGNFRSVGCLHCPDSNCNLYSQCQCEQLRVLMHLNFVQLHIKVHQFHRFHLFIISSKIKLYRSPIKLMITNKVLPWDKEIMSKGCI